MIRANCTRVLDAFVYVGVYFRKIHRVREWFSERDAKQKRVLDGVEVDAVCHGSMRVGRLTQWSMRLRGSLTWRCWSSS
jgi:hypothetical protein